MPHFFILSNSVNKDRISISDKENFHHIACVMRAKNGETLLLVDENRVLYKVVIENIDSNSITTKVVETSKPNNTLNLSLYLVQCVLKTDAQNLVVQKATELGVKGIIPIVSENSTIKAQIADGKAQKWQKIANEAVKQCERLDFPVIERRITLKDFLESSDFAVKIACVERSDEMTLKACLQDVKSSMPPYAKIAILIGPEGGFSAAEIKLLEHADIYRVSLGKLILRAETAVISALSNVIYELEGDLS